ncbi:Stk1 family PASTA domain-containing Ser/Thr kinase [Massilimicrobiota timonensis]|uniref:non-specific serine/threonine protein kinase n=1 Tax=Massilimicrobiota timonensis TaxID=1776392 RepID=A0A1Y4T0R1_9FIRM|nr:Stk1 family PASTA domain-containing Ser/Thr kinase [Massilimicrobiota timonensis]OUQ35230.1 serine/threonine protein kinase [Massilimicrobiota timonensis]
MSLVNKTIAGRYQLKRLIGQGGMADVYEAEDLILGRTVAVKIMRSSLTGDPVYVTRFHREASAAAALSHKNIVEIYDVGDEKDDYYIVMEYVPGQTLKELIHKRGALHYVEAVDIMKQVVSATAKAHAIGIIHRDLKPQNIMVTDSGVVKIGDFGIASIQSLSQVTQTDTIMGSLHYLAPEIARGEKATAQSDIYALGIVFYELLRGEVPFNGESPVNIALKHMRDEIPSVRAFNPSIPQSVENIIMKATAKNIKDRYLSASDMLDDLNHCLEAEHMNDEKITFDYQEDEDLATIVADDKDFFTQTHTHLPIEEEKEEKPSSRSHKKMVMIIGASVVAVLVILMALYFFVMKPSQSFEMPDVLNLNKDEAVTLLEEKDLKVSDNITYELSDDVEEGKVISSDPVARTQVKKGDEVSLVVSSGQYIVIENYVGKDYDSVASQLEDLGFDVKKEEKIDEKSKGTILEQSLEVGKKIDPNSDDKSITLTVSQGYSAVVPNVYGQDIQKAKSILEEAGFVVELNVLDPPTSVEEIKTMKINVVEKQSLDAFTTVYKKGEKITLDYYNTKPEIPETPAENTPTTPETNTPATSQPSENQTITNQ